MNLRKLELKDAPLMLEWMHDEDVTEYMNKDFTHMTLEDCRKFIAQSQIDSPSIHRAIADDNDVYMGTVSLKNVNLDRKEAEFAIIVRKEAMSKGFAEFGMKEIITLGFTEFYLDNIYWNVLKDNVRAIRFYEKNGYKLASKAEAATWGGTAREQVFMVCNPRKWGEQGRRFDSRLREAGQREAILKKLNTEEYQSLYAGMVSMATTMVSLL